MNGSARGQQQSNTTRIAQNRCAILIRLARVVVVQSRANCVRSKCQPTQLDHRSE